MRFLVTRGARPRSTGGPQQRQYFCRLGTGTGSNSSKRVSSKHVGGNDALAFRYSKPDIAAAPGR